MLFQYTGLSAFKQGALTVNPADPAFQPQEQC